MFIILLFVQCLSKLDFIFLWWACLNLLIVLIGSLGSFHISTCNGEKYFRTIVDDFSKETLVYLMHFKVDFLQHLKNVFQYVHTQFSSVVKTIRTDNTSDFFKRECTLLFNFLGIVHQSFCSYTHNKMESLDVNIDIYTWCSSSTAFSVFFTYALQVRICLNFMLSHQLHTKSIVEE